MTTIHNVIILDKSGSMSLDNKYQTAEKGIQLEIEELRKDKNASYTQTIVEFSGEGGNSNSRVEHCFMIPLTNIHSFTGAGAGGGTPLYETIGQVIEKLLRYVNKGEKVLLKIFTDGEENTSKGKYEDPAELKKLISKVEEQNGFIVTFEGTKFDGERVAKEVGINVNNMHFHDNTMEGLTRGVKSRIGATFAYTESLSKGIDNSQQFYSAVAPEPENTQP